MPTRSDLGSIIAQLRACRNSTPAASIHAVFMKLGLLSSLVISNHVIACYVRLRALNLAHNVFDDMIHRNVVSWTNLINGHTGMQQPLLALSIYASMLKSSVTPNAVTLSALINACSVLADDRTGKQAHTHVEIFGFQNNVVVSCSLVHFYGKCSDIDQSRRVFSTMGCRNIVAKTSLMAACIQNKRGSEALQLFREFTNQKGQIDYNHFMLATVINACASLEQLSAGKSTHCAAIRFGYISNHVICSALVDMYGKSGSFEYSHRTFAEILNPCVVSYTSLIIASAKYGKGAMSLNLFEEMISHRIKPNGVTLLGLLYACSHAGLVDEGLQYFNSMHEKYGVLPVEKHYSCVVDMLSRAGRLDEAYLLVKSMKENSEQRAFVWCTLVSASRLQGRVDIAYDASKRLIELNEQVDGAYVTISNACAVAGEWEVAENLRLQLARSGVHKKPACSWDALG